MSELEQKQLQLLRLSHELGDPARDLAILGEGNTSIRLSAERFLVKASGSSLGTLRSEDTVECLSEPLLELMNRADATDGDVDEALVKCRVNPSAKRPSVEALFHAYFLSLPGVHVVGHTHPVAINSILCSHRAAEFAENKAKMEQEANQQTQLANMATAAGAAKDLGQSGMVPQAQAA